MPDLDSPSLLLFLNMCSISWDSLHGCRSFAVTLFLFFPTHLDDVLGVGEMEAALLL